MNGWISTIEWINKYLPDLALCEWGEYTVWGCNEIYRMNEWMYKWMNKYLSLLNGSNRQCGTNRCGENYIEWIY